MQAIRHPQASSPALAAGPAPRYMVFGDGKVLHYHPALARLAGWTGAEELPERHVRGIAAAREREAAVRAAQAEQQRRQEEQEALLRAQREPARGAMDESQRLARAGVKELRGWLAERGVAFDAELGIKALRELALRAAEGGA